MRRGDILLHVVNHATYHRGHIAMMMYGMSTSPRRQRIYRYFCAKRINRFAADGVRFWSCPFA